MDVFELNDGGRAAVELEAEDALEFAAARVVVDDFGGDAAIDAEGDFVADANEMVFVPVFEFEPGGVGGFADARGGAVAVFVEGGAFAAESEVVAAVFVVEANEPGCLEIVVDLVAADVVIRKEAGAKLEAAVDGAFAVKTRFEFEFEVSEFAAGEDQILIGVAGAVFGDAAGDGAVFDGPVGGLGNLPAVEGAAVEDGFEVGVGGEGSCDGESEKECSQWHRGRMAGLWEKARISIRP